ncbi:hypothetical protein ABH987_002801 [Bradyrhizobium ottawaense]
MIETSGVADPADIVRNLMDPVILREAPLETVLCVIDAATPPAALDDALQRSQLRVADIVALTKLDLAEEGAGARMRQAIRALRLPAVVVEARHGEIPSALLFPANVERAPVARDPGPKRPAEERFETLSWTSDRPISLPRLQQAIGKLAPKLARAKGLFETVEQPGRQMVFQFAAGRATLAPGGEAPAPGAPRTRIVFIAELARRPHRARRAHGSSSSPNSACCRRPSSTASWRRALPNEAAVCAVSRELGDAVSDRPVLRGGVEHVDEHVLGPDARAFAEQVGDAAVQRFLLLGSARGEHRDLDQHRVVAARDAVGIAAAEIRRLVLADGHELVALGHAQRLAHGAVEAVENRLPVGLRLAGAHRDVEQRHRASLCMRARPAGRMRAPLFGPVLKRAINSNWFLTRCRESMFLTSCQILPKGAELAAARIRS